MDFWMGELCSSIFSRLVISLYFFLLQKAAPLYGAAFSSFTDMRKILYSFYIAFILLFLSCSKGKEVADPKFGTVEFKSIALQTIRIVESSTGKSPSFGLLNTLSGDTRFQFFLEDNLLLDTSLSVNAYKTNSYALIKADATSQLMIIDGQSTKMNSEVLPDSGFVKFSFINASANLPSKINAYVTTNTYVGNQNLPVQVAEFANISVISSAFKKVLVGTTNLGSFAVDFTITVKDAADQAVLGTYKITLPVYSYNKNKLQSTVYVISLQDNNVASILLSK